MAVMQDLANHQLVPACYLSAGRRRVGVTMDGFWHGKKLHAEGVFTSSSPTIVPLYTCIIG